jgi:hypothetical protein
VIGCARGGAGAGVGEEVVAVEARGDWRPGTGRKRSGGWSVIWRAAPSRHRRCWPVGAGAKDQDDLRVAGSGEATLETVRLGGGALRRRPTGARGGMRRGPARSGRGGLEKGAWAAAGAGQRARAGRGGAPGSRRGGLE